MALKFGPQWLRDLSDGGAGGSQPCTPTLSVKFKLADYRYGREEMLSLYNENSHPPDQVRKHLSIFSEKIQKPITLMPLTEDEQRLISQGGFNSTVVLRVAGRGSGPPLRGSRGGGTADRSRGRGRGRGEGYIRPENGDVGFNRPAQDGWEHVGRKFERSYSRGYDESGGAKREFSRSSSDNWRDKGQEDEEEEEGGATWRNTRDSNPRWGLSSSRHNWREPQKDMLGFEGERRPPPMRRGFDPDSQVARRTSESCDNDGEVPEWVEGDVGDDPGTFDSSGAFVSTKDTRRLSDTRQDTSNLEKTGSSNSSQAHKPPGNTESHSSNSTNEKVSHEQSSKSTYIPPNSRNGTGDSADSKLSVEQHLASLNNQTESIEIPTLADSSNSSHRGGGESDSGFAFPSSKETNGTSAPPGQYTNPSSLHVTLSHSVTSQKPEQARARPRLTDPGFVHIEKSLQNLVASLAADHNSGRPVDVSQGALPLTHENSNKWFYRDPQGEVQGPFTNEEMAQWFSAGFFTMSLVIKRGCDDSFKQLGELIKRYGRVPFLPGPPLPPLITSIPPEPTIVPTPPPPPLTVSPLPPPSQATPLVNLPNPLLLQHMMIQQEYLKQTFLMRQMQVQTLHQMQEQDSFKSLTPEQQQHLSMQMMMQANPVFVQHLQSLQQQQQQQLMVQQQQQEQQHRISPITVAAVADGNPTFPQPQTQPVGISSTTAAALAATTTSSISGSSHNSAGNIEKAPDDSLAWGGLQQYLMPGVWSQSASQPAPPQPMSLWDIDAGNGALSPAYLAQLEKIKRERKEERLKEEERLSQENLQKEQEEIRRQQEELEKQRTQMRRELEELEELERQKQIKLQKIEEARRLDEERVRQELERQQAEERKRQEEEKKRLEEERKRDRELKKQEEKRKKEEEKRKQQEEQKHLHAEIQRKKEEELLRQQELQHQREVEMQRQRQQEILQQQQEEEERMQREAVERLEVQRRQQYELQRQQESLRRLQQAQRDQLSNMQLPASSNWAAQQLLQGSPSQSRSLTEIQEEEARREQEMEQELLHQQLQRLKEQSNLKQQQQQQQQQKSWATHASQGVPTKGVSLLDIQQQEQENAKKEQKDKPNNQSSYQAKLLLASASMWTGTPSSGGTWNSQPVWNSSSSSTVAFWDQVNVQSVSKKSSVKESGEFPALKNQSQQAKKNTEKSSKNKGSGAKQKKEEESIQKLFQTRQQDDFSHWVTEHVTKFCAPIDVPTFVSFIVEVDSPDDVREYMKTYLGDTKESKEFARQYMEKRNYFRNQARLVKQQEEDSIWGPAPAINPHNQVRGGGGGGGSSNNTLSNDSGESGKGKNRKKKQKMQKLDGSILGFTVHADPNRKNAAGEVESIQ